MSAEQRDALEAGLRQGSFPADSDISEQRRLLRGVFQTFHTVIDEATAALDRAGQFLSAHLASADHVTV